MPAPVTPGSVPGSIPTPKQVGPPTPQNNLIAGLPGGLSVQQGGPTANPYVGGSATAQGGYNNAIQTLKDALQNTQGIYSGQEAQAGQQLKQNQGAVAQNLTNKGLGNTTLSSTMQQAPLQTYNQAMLNIANSQAQATNSQYDQLANMYGGGGQALGALTNQTNQQGANQRANTQGQQSQAAMLGAQMSNANANQANAYGFDPNWGNDILASSGNGGGYSIATGTPAGGYTMPGSYSGVNNGSSYSPTSMASLWSSLGGSDYLPSNVGG